MSILARARSRASARQTAFALLDGLWTGPVALAVLDRSLRLVDVNAKMAKMLDVAPGGAAGRGLAELAAGWSAPLRRELERVIDACRVVLDTGKPFLNLVVQGAPPGGGRRDWLCSFLPIPAPGGPVRGVLATISDATNDRERESALARARDDAQRALAAEREACESEARSRALLDGMVENAPLGIAFIDRDLRIRRVNAQLAEIDGLAPEAHVGRTLRELFARGSQEPGGGCDPLTCAAVDGVEATARQVLATGEPVIDRELQVATTAAPARLRTFLESCYPVRSGGEVLGLGALVREVTAEREADEFRRRVLGVVGHDLRTPLAALATSAQVLVRSPLLPPELSRAVLRILANAARMDRIITMLLDYARLQAGQPMPLCRGECDVSAVARVVADEFGETHPGREIRISGTGDPAGEWDPDRVAEALSNLVSNALSYGSACSPVEVRWREDGDALCLDVSNEGAPIPAEQLARIFEPFHRAAGLADDGKGGLGLGLFIVRAIAVAHGGEALVRSAAGAGTTFTIRLPRRPEPG